MEGFIAGLTLMGFIWLSAYSLTHQIHKTKEVIVWRDERSRIIGDIFNIKPDEIDKATHIFGE